MGVQVRKTITTTVHNKVRLTANDIRKFLGVPEIADVTFEVPRGGDYNGQTLQIDEQADGEQTICVSWSETKVEE
jgi:hypothetical protein